jgi:Mrp family chromosome partitioning ATPase
VLGVLCIVAGVLVCALSTRAVLTDETYYRAAFALERHADHILYQAEYQAALARHVAYIVTAVVSGVGGVVGSALLLGLAAVLQRLGRPAATPR